MKKKEVSLQEKANTIAGYKHFVESRKGVTKSTFDYIFKDIYLLSIIGQNECWSNLFIPKKTHLICKRIPKNLKPDCIIEKDPTPFLELGRMYTIKQSIVGESFSWCELQELPEYRVHLSWFKIAPEDVITPEQAINLYTGNIDEEYEYVDRYLEMEKRKRRHEEEMKPREIFIYNGLRFDNFSLDNFDDDFKGDDYMHIDLCEECAKKYHLPENLISKEPYNGEPFDLTCSRENCCNKAVYGYAIPLKDGKIIKEKKVIQ